MVPLTRPDHGALLQMTRILRRAVPMVRTENNTLCNAIARVTQVNEQPLARYLVRWIYSMLKGTDLATWLAIKTNRSVISILNDDLATVRERWLLWMIKTLEKELNV